MQRNTVFPYPYEDIFDVLGDRETIMSRGLVSTETRNALLAKLFGSRYKN